MKGLFFSLLFLTAYPYAVYPLLVFVGSRLFSNPWRQEDIKPPISVIISVYNEERVVAEKVRNALSLEYPEDRLEIIVSSDGSTDRTNEIVSSFHDARLVLKAFSERSGKTACLNRVVLEAKGDLILFTDANSMFPSDVLFKMARNFADPSVGLVTGWTQYGTAEEGARNTGLYATLEKMTKHWESFISSAVGADGAIFAIRKELYKPLDDSDINDFVTPLDVVAQKKRAVLDPEVYCLEEEAQGELKEFRRQARITNRTLRAIRKKLGVLNPLEFGSFSFFVLSHKVIRFMVPYFFVMTLFMSLMLSGASLTYGGFFFLHLVLITLGAAGLLRLLDGRLVSLCRILLVTWSAQLLGWGRMIFGKTDTTWTPQR